jgi:hypothetical protein
MRSTRGAFIILKRKLFYLFTSRNCCTHSLVLDSSHCFSSFSFYKSDDLFIQLYEDVLSWYRSENSSTAIFNPLPPQQTVWWTLRVKRSVSTSMLQTRGPPLASIETGRLGAPPRLDELDPFLVLLLPLPIDSPLPSPPPLLHHLPLFLANERRRNCVFRYTPWSTIWSYQKRRQCLSI